MDIAILLMEQIKSDQFLDYQLYFFSELAKRFPRTMRNLERAIERLPHVLVFDNSDLANPFRKVAEFVNAKVVMLHEQIPAWLPIKKKRRRKRKS